jgi:hypothetical protein
MTTLSELKARAQELKAQRNNEIIANPAVFVERSSVVIVENPVTEKPAHIAPVIAQEDLKTILNARLTLKEFTALTANRDNSLRHNLGLYNRYLGQLYALRFAGKE